MDPLLRKKTLFIIFLLVVSLVGMAVRRFRILYTVALVVVGLLVTSQSALRNANHGKEDE